MNLVIIVAITAPLAIYFWVSYRNAQERHSRKHYDLENFSQRVKAELAESKKRREEREAKQTKKEFKKDQ